MKIRKTTLKLENYFRQSLLYNEEPDPALMDKSIEILKLEYERAGRMFADAGSTFLGSVAICVALYGRVQFRFGIFLILVIISLIRGWNWNVKMNKIFATLRYKLEAAKK